MQHESKLSAYLKDSNVFIEQTCPVMPSIGLIKSCQALDYCHHHSNVTYRTQRHEHSNAYTLSHSLHSLSSHTASPHWARSPHRAKIITLKIISSELIPPRPVNILIPQWLAVILNPRQTPIHPPSLSGQGFSPTPASAHSPRGRRAGESLD